jgi:quinol monooxygenase YgiN
MIVVRFKLRSQPEHTDRVKAALERVLAASQDVEGVVRFDVAQDLGDPNAFIATEVFDDRAALARQESRAEVAEAMALFGEALAGEPEATIYEVASSEPYEE